MMQPNCTAVKLTSDQGRPYWFRTCDIGGDVWKSGAHPVSFPAGTQIPLVGRSEPFRFAHMVLGMTYNQLDTWMLDGVNDAGLVGGLLALYESTSVAEADPGRDGVMGMEQLTYLLGSCSTVDEVIKMAENMQITNVPMGDGKSVTSTMHCMFMEPTGKCVILEAADPGHPGSITVYRENLGMMTNSPPYPQQLDNLRWYLSQSPELNWGKEGPASLTLNGMTVTADPQAPHFSMSGTFPASYASCDRLIRMAVLSSLNEEGRGMPDEQILPLGENLMSAVFEPHNQGVFHYIRFDEKEGPEGGHESYSQYLVMYDPARRAFCVKPYDSTAWTRLAMDECPKDRIGRYEVCHDPIGGVRGPEQRG